MKKLLRQQLIFVLGYCISWLSIPLTRVCRRSWLNARLAKNKQIYLVLQPGKVGSKSIVSHLQRTRIDDCPFHIHYLNLSKSTTEQAGPLGRDLIFPQINSFDFFERRLIAYSHAGGKIKVVCGVRDPWSRGRSAFRQNLESILAYGSRRTTRHTCSGCFVSMRTLITLFHNFNSKFYIEWFDKELFRLTGIDVYQHPFPVEDGYATLSNQCFDVFLYRYDRLGELGIQYGLNQFIGAPDVVTIPRTNAYPECEVSLVASIQACHYPDSVNDYFVHSRLVKHFFTEDEIDAFAARELEIQLRAAGHSR